MSADPPRIDQLLAVVRSRQALPIAPHLIAFAQRIAERPPEVLTDEQITAWAARLAADVAGAND